MHDVLVVGGGSAGAMFAARLARETALRILLIEAGDIPGSEADYPEGARHAANRDATYIAGHPSAWPYQVDIGAGRQWRTVRGRILGGSSAINGGYFIRGVPGDYDEWASLGIEGWSYKDVLPSFRAIERDLDFGGCKHGQDGPIEVRRAAGETLSPLSSAFMDACVQAGFPIEADKNAGGPPGAGLVPGNITEDGSRSQPGIACILRGTRPANLDLLGRALVRRILFDRGRAAGVEISEEDGTRRRILAGEVVLSAGAINSPHLMMLSGVGPADMLRKAGISVVQDMQGVGHAWSDDPGIWIPVRRNPAIPPASLAMLSPQAALHFNGLAGDLELMLFTHPVGQNENSILCCLHRGQSRGAMEIVSSDPAVPLKMSYNYLTVGDDLERLTMAVETCVDLAGKAPFDGVLDVPAPGLREACRNRKELGGWIRRNLASTCHTTGTLKMGASSDAGSVVDSRLRVHGLEGLSVIDASVIPQPLSRGPSATAMMLGHHAAGLWKR